MLKLFGVALVVTILWTAPAMAQDANNAKNDEKSTSDNPAHDEATWRVDAGRLIIKMADGSEQVVFDTAVVSAYKYKDKLYVALGANGVAVVPLSGNGAGEVRNIIPVSHGKVTELVEMDGALWMKVDSTTAVRLAESDAVLGAPVVTPVSPASVPAIPRTGEAANTHWPLGKADAGAAVTLKIEKMYPGMVTLDKGANEGVRAGDRFNVYRNGDISGAGIEGFSGEQVVAVLVVEAVNDSSCLARIWRGDRLRLSDEVKPADGDGDASLAYPRKFDGVGEVSATIRPIVNIGARGFGVLADVMLAWYGRHVFADFRIQPLGLGSTDGSNVVTNSLVVSGGYNGRAFAVGLGAGLTSVNGDLSEMMHSMARGYNSADSAGDTEDPEWEQSTQHAFSLVQRVRLGAQEGLNLSVSNTLLYYRAGAFDDNPTGFIYGGTTGRITWPLSMRVDMFMEGGGGIMGYGFGALGVFTWVRGNGDGGSIGLSASAGGAGIWSERKREYANYTDTETISIGGPMFSIGMTYRFGGKQRQPDNSTQAKPQEIKVDYGR